MDFNAKTNPGRESRLQQLEEDKVWDVLIIGGGATGAGIAVDAAARGFSTRRTSPRALPAVPPN
uniref:hypothetical protein n=1 Tax=Parasutterella excrementihominis TaxID=487175 RepID=UPI003FF05379